jgi:hypothetical protein
MTNDKRNSIKITAIACNGTSEDGNDEVYIIYQPDAGLPVRYPATSCQRMNISADPDNDVVQRWDFDLTLDFDYEVLVTLWDQDVMGMNNVSTFLINHDYTAGAPPASVSMSNNNGANYTIYAELNS